MELSCSLNKDSMKSFTVTPNLEAFDKGRWQWRSNPDPFSKSEAPKWEFYSLEDNYLIEKAYKGQRKEIYIGEYVVSIKYMIQKKKGSAMQQRHIRRVNREDSIEERDRSERYFETELPKTMNKVFGSLGDFILFFSRRNPKILDFASQFKEIEKSNSLNCLNLIIIPRVAQCLEQLAQPILEQLNIPSLSGPKKKIKKSYEELISLFKESPSSSFEEFYGKILKAYTMNTCLYEKLNNSLRNENWTEIDNLLPYAFCLCKVFFNFNLRTDPSQDNEMAKIGTENDEPRSIILYRGTALDEVSLCFYKNAQISQQPFSWNCVTSTSTNVEIAKKFMYENVDLKNEKYPVLFIIESQIPEDNEESGYLKWIDIHQHSSKVEEDEVILAPGSVFEIMEVSTDKDQRTRIRLKMKNKTESLAHGGLIMQGALQSKMMTEKDVRIVCLEGEELSDTLKCLAGNKLIEEVEFCMCKFDKKSLTAMMEIISTLERAQELKLISCEYEDQENMSSGFLTEVQRCNISRVEISGSSGFDGILNVKNEENVNWISLRELKIAFGGRKNDSDSNGINDKIFQRFRHFNQLRSLTLDFFLSSLVLNPTNICLIFYEIKYLIQLTSLTLNFIKHRSITDEGVYSLAFHGLKHLIQLTSLTLNFAVCEKITDKGMKSLASEGLRNLIQLTSLTLNFTFCFEITDNGMRSLASEGLRNLIKLTSLDLNLSCCDKITDEGVSSLAFQGLQNLTQLTILTLKFPFCNKITDEGVLSLALQGLQNLTKLTSLTLDFRHCEKITNKGVRSLASEGLRYLIQLKSLALNFTNWKGRTDGDEGMDDVIGEVPTYLSKFEWNKQDLSRLYFDSSSNGERTQTQQTLQVSERNQLTFTRVLDKQKQLILEGSFSTLTFKNFNADTQVRPCSYEAPQELYICLKKDHAETEFSLPLQTFSETLRVNSTLSLTNVSHHFSSLTSLTLDCSNYKEITDEGMQSLASEGLQNLTQLTSLIINFKYCRKITDEGVQSLTSKGLRHLTQLASLTIQFWACYKITDEGVRSLASQGLQSLPQLTFLALDFSECENITDEGVQSLASQGLQSLIKLKSLTLSFNGCVKITDEGVKSLSIQGIQHLTQLTFLDLDFWICEITNEGMRCLVSQGLRNLTQLTSLTLNFGSCFNITDKGVHSLAFQGLKHLTQLSSLTLNFQYCSKITDFMFSNLSRVLHYLGFVAE